MRILVSDYSGHPFQVQLSRALAGLGHTVLHVSAASFQTPKGRLERSADDPATFAARTVQTRAPFAKNTFLRRRSQEIELGKRIGEEIGRFAPDVVISSNAPLDAQRYIQRATRHAGAGFVFWVQDLYGEAISRILRTKLPVIGAAIGRYYQAMEARMLRAADQVVVICDDFTDLVASAGVARDRITTIENWAPLDEIDYLPRDNDWAAANLAAAPFRTIYSGTLGFKHNPDLLIAIARDIEGDMLVFSEGAAADSVRAAGERLPNLQVRGWLPFADLPSALAAADVLAVILEKDAGIFSVPSKVLTYMCVGRPIVAAVPAGNLAARLVVDNGAGLVCEPDDEAGFVAAVRRLRDDPDLRARMGRNARAYAERAFAIGAISTKFETILQRSVATRTRN